MMKLLVLVLVAVVFADHHSHHSPSDYVKYLQEIERSREYLMFTTEEKNLFQELLISAQKGPAELNKVITAKSFDQVLRLTDKLNKDDIPHWEEMLAYYSDPTIFQGVPSHHDKRQLAPMDLFEWMTELHIIHKIEDDLHKEDRAAFMALMYAVEHDTLTTYIDQVGYAKIFKILSEIDEDYEHQIDQMLIKHLEKERAMGIGQPQGTTMMPTATV